MIIRAAIAYEKLDGKQLQQREILIGNQQFLEIAYGWTDIAAL
jgi:hypothetical protein